MCFLSLGKKISFLNPWKVNPENILCKSFHILIDMCDVSVQKQLNFIFSCVCGRSVPKSPTDTEICRFGGLCDLPWGSQLSQLQGSFWYSQKPLSGCAEALPWPWHAWEWIAEVFPCVCSEVSGLRALTQPASGSTGDCPRMVKSADAETEDGEGLLYLCVFITLHISCLCNTSNGLPYK